jgi:hypothetical protein
VDSRLDALVVHALSFMAGLSFLGHKEWRFIIYVVPLLNVAAARGARVLSVSQLSPEIPLMPFDIKRVVAKRAGIGETMFRSVCWDAFPKLCVHFIIHPHMYGKLPWRRLSRPVQRAL